MPPQACYCRCDCAAVQTAAEQLQPRRNIIAPTPCRHLSITASACATGIQKAGTNIHARQSLAADWALTPGSRFAVPGLRINQTECCFPLPALFGLAQTGPARRFLVAL